MARANCRILSGCWLVIDEAEKDTVTLCSTERDDELLRRYARGDEAAFDALFHRHVPRIFAYLARLVGNREEAADLTQETFVRLLRTARASPPPENLRAFLYTVATNLARDHFRKERGRTRELTPEAALSVSMPPEPPDPRREHLIQQAISGLPAEQRAVLVLRFYHDLTFPEIAEVTGAPLSAVKARMRYAVERLRRRLGPLLEGECP